MIDSFGSLFSTLPDENIDTYLAIYGGMNLKNFIHFVFQLSTLRFGNRVMRIPNQPAKNIVYDPIRVCKSLEKEIADLRKELSIYDTLTNRRQITYEPLSEAQIQEIKGNVRKFIDGETSEIEIMNVRQVNQVFEHFKTLVKQAEKENDELRMKVAALSEDTNSVTGEKSRLDTC